MTKKKKLITNGTYWILKPLCRRGSVEVRDLRITDAPRNHPDLKAEILY